jgi:hypothetical protein
MSNKGLTAIILVKNNKSKNCIKRTKNMKLPYNSYRKIYRASKTYLKMRLTS